MSNTTTIALSTFPPRPETSASSSATTSTTGTSVAVVGGHHTSPSTPALASTQAPAVSPPSPPAPQQTSTATSTIGSEHAQNNLPPWLQKAKPFLTICSAAIKFTIAMLGISWAIYVGLSGLDLQKWSARNDSLQSCLALESQSEYCKATIEAGVKPPPVWKRNRFLDSSNGTASLITTALYTSPTSVAAAVVLTVSAVIAATVYFRPRTEPFHPVVSLARGTCTFQWQRVLKFAQVNEWSDTVAWYMLCSLVQGGPGPEQKVDSTALADKEQTIGSSYDSGHAKPDEDLDSITLADQGQAISLLHDSRADDEDIVFHYPGNGLLSSVCQNLARLEAYRTSDYTMPNTRKRDLLAKLDAVSFYILSACFFNKVGRVFALPS